VVPESHREWSWWGDGRTGFPVRAGRDRKTVCDGFYAISKTGPFKVYTFEHEVPESGPSPEDTELARSFPDRFEIIFETHFIGLKDIYIYGDEKDSEGRSGLLLITGR